jgi:hypothetical protein
LYSLPASPKANKQESVLDPSFTLQTTRSASDWADTYALFKGEALDYASKKVSAQHSAGYFFQKQRPDHPQHPGRKSKKNYLEFN